MSEFCFHCGQNIEDVRIEFDGKIFCCNGCKTVYEILNQNNLENYYELNEKAGIKPEKNQNHFDFLDTPLIFNKIIDYSEDGTTLVTFKIPVIHCSSCVWLLESLKEINKNIIYSTVNFTTKTVQIAYKSELYKLSELAYFLTDLGYKPIINLETADKKPEKVDRSLIIKIGIAGFSFGNIMLLAFPEFMDKEGDIWLHKYNHLFRILMFLLSLPVASYCASDYYKSAWAALKNKYLNIDLPIVVGILALFFRSCYEAYEGISNGYFDSLCGLLFFMLLGKYFQQRTYKYLAFDRDYKSFYPIAITKIDFNNKQENILISDLKVGDRILIRNNEIIPTDSILIKGDAFIDNSFITGESKLIQKKNGEKIFAGGKQIGAILELEVIKEVNQSYLTQLWNNDAFKKDHSKIDTLTNKISKYFVIFIFIITILSGLYWYFVKNNTSQMYQVITAILIVACPCALALSSPFTIGNMMRIFGRKKFYVKDALTIEKLSKVNHIVFDKTGTLTINKAAKINYEGEPLTPKELQNIKAVLQNSNHPLCRSLYEFIPTNNNYIPVKNFEEIIGKGIQGEIDKTHIKIGSPIFVGDKNLAKNDTSVYIQYNGKYKGRFAFSNQYRKNTQNIINSLKNYKISLLSGDNDSEKEFLKKIFPAQTIMKFNQSPQDKLEYIRKIQKNSGTIVMMLGDGLNDAGALKQADVGVAIADDVNSFTPSSDAILDGSSFEYLTKFLKLSKSTIHIIYICFFISFCYNIIGLSFAVSGELSPLIAAILMPISSISIVTFTTLATLFVGYKNFKIK
ncbi:heavy metal translocating P-type ATPase [Apibacter adventoris]|uniref:Heavy metal translocating P-type ATPase n=1 Tax=Apibacter adventoris TaxID=1679466 RepID=A0A2S8AGQ1_9FLAO|nr:heavy metal translocating P-type ATPase metal-binding domain-containing protein [Apibacter adventoris]PQL95561.1 heavy metal translocating P-type ATPase [Apibacter adventoris]